jgi:hypothetical protein
MNEKVMVLGLCCFFGLAGCGNDSPPVGGGGTADMASGGSIADMASGGSPADLSMSSGGKGKISGTVRYAGTKTGTLKFALYDQMPGPTTPPKYFMFPSVMSPSFPQPYTLDAIIPGDYYVVVILDVPPDNPAIPGPEDVVGVSMSKVTVPAGGTGMIDVTLPNM